MSILKLLIFSYSLNMGLIPNHQACLFVIPEEQTVIDIQRTYYADMETRLNIKWLYVGGGMTAYQWYCDDQGGTFYPFRMDYTLGAGIKYRNFEIGWAHDCFHPIAPNTSIFKYGKIDAFTERFFIKITGKIQVFK